ncbi:hypothetical protein CTAYLR_007208 [Chrysophaeum taylorii]|uniref:CAAX prenyl protease 2/Lysostaphin resistance protein A-like domain-containing protein n=1 Tax=Chrysophaeum taylorii TaxID=2483200 RepID=A0AAD7XR72_9STRA|nr:hypothetical protein CTAYLR_007208 [Chrysophaeum taylorii]
MRTMIRPDKRSVVVSAILLTMPSVIMWFECVRSTRAVRACLVFHLFMAIALVFHRGGEVRRSGAADPRPVGSFAAFLAIGLALYLCCRAASSPGEYLGVGLESFRDTLDAYGVDDPFKMAVFAVYFSTINPILEELFWRTVLRARLARDYDAKQAPPFFLGSPSDALAASAYAAYHAIIIANLMPPWFNLGVAFPFLVAFGQALAFVVDRKGLSTAIALHAALDLSAACWIYDLRFGCLDPFFAAAVMPTP